MKKCLFKYFILLAIPLLMINPVKGASTDTVKSKSVENSGFKELQAKLTDQELKSWKIYRNKIFEIKYPPELLMREDDSGVSFAYGFDAPLSARNSFCVLKTDLSPEQWIKAQYEKKDPDYPGGYGDFEYTEMFGRKVLHCVFGGVSTSYDSFLFQLDKHHLFWIYHEASSYGELPQDIFEKMLSTFKFIDIKGQ